MFQALSEKLKNSPFKSAHCEGLKVNENRVIAAPATGILLNYLMNLLNLLA